MKKITTSLKPRTKEHCRRGHRMTPENTYRRGDGYLQCRLCMALADRRYLERKKGSND